MRRGDLTGQHRLPEEQHPGNAEPVEYSAEPLALLTPPTPPPLRSMAVIPRWRRKSAFLPEAHSFSREIATNWLEIFAGEGHIHAERIDDAVVMLLALVAGLALH